MAGFSLNLWRTTFSTAAKKMFFYLFFIFIFWQLTPRDAPPCVCLPLSLFDLTAVPLSLLLHFIPLCGALVVLALALALSSYLGCLALLIYVYGCLSCPTRIICGCAGLFRFCFLVFPSCINPLPSWRRCALLCRLLSSRPPPSVCFLLSSLFVFICLILLCFFRPCSFSICFGVTSYQVYLVTTAGFVADQLILLLIM